MTNPSQVATHLAFNALFSFEASSKRWPVPGAEQDLGALNDIVNARLKAAGHVEEQVDETSAQVDEAATGPANLTFRQHLDNAVGELSV